MSNKVICFWPKSLISSDTTYDTVAGYYNTYLHVNKVKPNPTYIITIT